MQPAWDSWVKINPYDLAATAAPRAPAHRRDQKDAVQPHCHCALRKDGQRHSAAELLPQAHSPLRVMGGNPTYWHLDFGAESGLLLKNINKFKHQNESNFVPIFLNFRLGGLCSLDQAARGKHCHKAISFPWRRKSSPTVNDQKLHWQKHRQSLQPAAMAEHFISMLPA